MQVRPEKSGVKIEVRTPEGSEVVTSYGHFINKGQAVIELLERGWKHNFELGFWEARNASGVGMVAEIKGIPYEPKENLPYNHEVFPAPFST